MKPYKTIHIDLPESQVAVIDVLKDLKLVPSRAQYVARLIERDMRERHMSNTRIESESELKDERGLSDKQVKQITLIIKEAVDAAKGEIPKAEPKVEPEKVIARSTAPDSDAAKGKSFEMFGKKVKTEDA